MTDRTEMIEVLTEEHGFNEESLDGMGDTCLERTYNSFVEDDIDDTDDSEQTEEAAVNVDELADELEDRFSDQFVTADELDEAVANVKEAEERQELAAEIVANSDEYEDVDGVLDDFPTNAALETKLDDVTEDEEESGFANFRAQRGAAANGGGGEAESFPDLTASAHLEGDD